jgi:succinoglycan biosynthesis protein ExoM
MNILICICTYHRNLELEKCIKSFKKTYIPSNFNIKFLVVDNSINNNALNIINSLRKKTQFNIKYVSETKRGIVNARNKVLIESKKIRSDYIAFFDDDCLIDKFWFKNIKSLIKNYSIITGPQLYQKSKSNKKNLSFVFEKKYKNKLQYVNWAATNNVLFQSNILKYKKLKFDIKLNKFSMGEDQLFFSQLNKMGHKIIWSRNVKVYENYHEKRSDLKEIAKRSFRLGILSHYIDQKIYGNFKGILINYLKTFYYLLLSLFELIKISKKNYFYNVANHFSRFLGKLIGPIIFQKIIFYKK